MSEYKAYIKTQGKKLRTTKLPTRSDILTIMKKFDKVSFADLRKELNVSLDYGKEIKRNKRRLKRSNRG
jgi:hypothetical protein